MRNRAPARERLLPFSRAARWRLGVRICKEKWRPCCCVTGRFRNDLLDNHAPLMKPIICSEASDKDGVTRKFQEIGLLMDFHSASLRAVMSMPALMTHASPSTRIRLALKK